MSPIINAVENAVRQKDIWFCHVREGKAERKFLANPLQKGHKVVLIAKDVFLIEPTSNKDEIAIAIIDFLHPYDVSKEDIVKELDFTNWCIDSNVFNKSRYDKFL